MNGTDLNFGNMFSGGFDAISKVPSLFSQAISTFGGGTAGVAPAGGYTVPPELMEKIITLAGEGGGSKMNPMLQNIGGGISALGGLAQIYTSLKAVNLAQKDFDFQKSAYRNNLEASTKTYNTALMDRANNRANQYGDSGYATRYYNENKLAPTGV